jgi:diphthamide biosynthesis protein 3
VTRQRLNISNPILREHSTAHNASMENLYDEIEIEDCFYDETLQIYHHPCPCGDRFEISMADMRDGEDIARCPSCSLMIRIIFDEVCSATPTMHAAR